MQVDAVGDSSQQSLHSLPAKPAQAASSDDCSAVNLNSSTLAQDGATSTHQQPGKAQQRTGQHAQQAVGSNSSQKLAPQQGSAADAPVSGRPFRKRKQPLFKDEHAAASTSTSISMNANLPQTQEQKAQVPTGSQPKGKQTESNFSGQHSQASAGSKKSKASALGIKAKGKRSKYDAVVGCTIDVPAPIFGVDIPDLYYRGRILKKDPAHPGSMVVRFLEDGSRYWFPLPEIERFLKDMHSKGRDSESDTIGQGSHAFAAQVLAGTLVAKKNQASGVTCSSATAGSLGIEVSSCVQQAPPQAPVPSRFSQEGSASKADEQTSSLQALAAAADSGGV